MRPLPAADEALLRRWMTRVLAGYWTHSGYLNWDTGFSFGRWHQTKKLGLAQQALIGMAAGGRLTPSARESAWAKWILERGFELYERRLPPDEGVAPGLFFPLTPHPQSDKQALLGAGRIGANAARAVIAGVAARPEAKPPSLYAFDPTTGRLAITTSRYNTAITAVTHGAYPYGGIDLARLFDHQQEVAATLGSRQPASFGVVIRNRNGRTRLVTARPASDDGGRRRPLRLLRAPVGVGSAGTPCTRSPARSTSLRVTGMARGSGRERAVDLHVPAQGDRRRLDRAGASTRKPRSAEVLFPSYGGDQAAVWAILKSGEAVKLDAARPLQGIRGFWIQSAKTGYAVFPVDRVKGSVVKIIQPKPQASAPNPGPTLSVFLTRRVTRKRPVVFSAKLAIARTVDEAQAALR